ncbi:MAG: pantoate--beta-alanine ligase [Dehalococcoidales bacterium]|nr:pantoate--beta-alanine ligase [Dehalococcoidales bacterium]MDP6221602.1 pantoate--beta-alanine ligase [Dehalococcoidales bacterium]MDP7109898.1 pantoate--beta-alanine ligase [Dehalococcoidales bacterium]MDP7309820.1 pantoate--beta-alanine ligase [Dehalococcoidales bacterium]MDP7409774.1 pantoate--beta-alanine ligase [Dehalococcoidales bacterium]
MKVIKTIAAMKRTRLKLPKLVGFVPTMGYLHEGHLELIRRAKAENPWTVASIFVNPRQFGPQEDYTSYPRNIPRDLAMLEAVKTDIVFIPPTAEMYPPRYNTWVDIEKVTERLEGSIRPGHFRGVATVCTKLFNIVQPTKAYFGQKDAQQVIAIKRMVTDLNMNLEIIVAPTVREPDGLAMSSRNTYLKPDERQTAVVLYRALKLAQKLWSQGEQDVHRIRQAMTEMIKQEPLAEEITYISIADAKTLEELHKIEPPALVSLAVKIGRPRLIDNIILE